MGTLKVIVVAFQRVIPLQTLINCFLVQTDPHWELYIIHDGPAPEEIKKNIPSDPRVHFTESPTRLGKYGHPNRRFMLQTIPVIQKDYVLITNDDNYYVPTYVGMMRSKFSANVGLIYTDCLHSYYSYDVLKTQLRINYVDMGSFAVRADIARAVGFTSDEFHADGIYAEACAAKCNQMRRGIEYIPKAVFIHN